VLFRSLALLSAHVGNLPALKLSAQRPLEGIDIAIAGFPAFQLKVWLQQTKGQELRPSFHEGHVNALTLGDFYVQYDALTDQGNSGGPLFDAQTGAVYGVVDESVKGESVSNNLALSEVVLRRFVASLALAIKSAPTDRRLGVPADQRAVEHQSDACTTALIKFSKHFNELINARALEARSHGLKGTVMADYAKVRAGMARRGLARDVDAIQASGAHQTAGLAQAVYQDVTATSDATESPTLKADVQKFDTLGDCSTD